MRFTAQLRLFQSRLSLRLALLLTLLILLFTVEFGTYATIQARWIIERNLEENVARIGSGGAKLIGDDPAAFNRPEMREVLRRFAERTHLTYVNVTDGREEMKADGIAAPPSGWHDELFVAAMRSGLLQIANDGDIVNVAQPIRRDETTVGVLRFGMPLAGSKTAIAAVTRNNIIAALMFLVFAVPLTALVSRRMTLSIRNLTKATRRIAAGDLSTEIAQHGSDEVSELGRSISIMVKNLSESADAIRSLTFTDQLTGLSNRDQLEERITTAIQGLKENGQRIALFIVDLDRFNRVNDALGQDQGDRILKEVAGRLLAAMNDWQQSASRPGRTPATLVSRLSADEFGIMATGAIDEEARAAILRRIMRSFDAAFETGGHALDLKASIGVALAPDDAPDFKTLLQDASVALQAAKNGGRATFRSFSADLDERAYRRLMLESELRQAIAHGLFEIHYQPQISCRDGLAVGAEALVRWRHPTRGLISPAEFIPLAEETGLIVDIGAFVLRRVCAQATVWAERGLNPRLAVNVSSVQFQREDFADFVLQTVEDSGMDPAQLELEITESMAMHDPASIIAQMAPLRAVGIRFALDDFGTGYSNLSVLRRIPFDALKIDRSFIHEVAKGLPGQAVLVTTMLGMARGLGFEVVAEGVERPEDHAFLRDNHCEYAQGYLFAPAMWASEFETWFVINSRAEASPLPTALKEVARTMAQDAVIDFAQIAGRKSA